ncbi:LuxR C-terminal-related transcriptional regulator [Lentzea sp. NPDC054927]
METAVVLIAAGPLAEATVQTHINNLFAKADLRSRADAVRLALALRG